MRRCTNVNRMMMGMDMRMAMRMHLCVLTSEKIA